MLSNNFINIAQHPHYYDYLVDEIKKGNLRSIFEVDTPF